ncbi:MAG: hypothetical protein AAF401_01970 [Pseudomonadota bacterium]
MKSSIVLTGAASDAVVAATWAEGEARSARFSNERAEELAQRVQRSYRAAAKAFFGASGEDQQVMVCLDLNTPTPRFELITEGEQARGAVSGARGLSAAERRRSGLLDGLTCLSVPARI